MNIGSYLSPLLTAATQATSAYQGAQAREGDKSRAEAVQQIAMLRAQHEQEIKDLLTTAQTRNANRQADALRLGDPGYAGAQGAVKGAEGMAAIPSAVAMQDAMTPGAIHRVVGEQQAMIPGKVAEQNAMTPGAVARAGAVESAQVPGKIAAAQGTSDFAAPIATQDVPGGPVTYKTRSQALGSGKAPTGANGALAAPMAAKVGQAGEMLKKASDLLPAMDALDVHLGGSAAQDIATHGLGVGSLRIPGTQGLGSAMLNNAPDYATYQASLSPFVLAAAHALSGARINDEQVKQIRSSIELKPGDTPQVRAQKKKNVIDLMNSINGSLPPDAVAAQEAQMDAPALTTLRNGGYKGAAKATTPQRRSTDVPAPAAVPSYEDWKKAQGIP